MNPSNNYNEKSISIHELIALLKRYALILLAAGVIGGIIAYCVCSFMITPVYQADAKMIVNSRQEQTGSVTNDQITSAQKLVDTYAIIIRGRRVLAPVIDSLGLSMSVETLASMVTVTSVNETQVMRIAVRSEDPQLAYKIAEKIVSTCPPIIVDAVEAGSVKTIEPVYLHKNPVAPRTNLYTVITAALCMAISTVVVVLVVLLDNTYKSESVLRAELELPVLGVIPDYESCKKPIKDVKEGLRHVKLPQKKAR